MNRLDIYDRVTNQIIADLENGIMPYTKPWKDGVGRAGFAFPANATTEKPYSGINTLILWCAGSAMDYPTQRWLTFKQALDAGGNVRKGEKGETIVRASTFVPKDEKKAARDEDRDPASVPFLKAYTVFNVAQCDGLDEDVIGAIPEAPDDGDLDLPINEQAERTIAASGARIVPHPDKAFYRPSDDVIAMPPMRAFHEPVNYYRTMMHELAHFTGAAHRLDRLPKFARFGSEAYAREELVAECASGFLCAAHGIVPTIRHADYIGNWLTVLKNDNRAIFSAASHAQKAADWLLDRAEKYESHPSLPETIAA